jgi:hypothetical protein
VSELLAHGGFLPQLADLYKKNAIFTRRNGVVFSVLWCLFFLLVMAPLWGIADVDELAGASAVIGIFGGLIFLVASLTLLRKSPPAVDLVLPSGQLSSAPATLYARPSQSALPPQQSQPVSNYAPPGGGWKTPDTGEFTRHGSVTEDTTKLLQKEDE